MDDRFGNSPYCIRLMNLLTISALESPKWSLDKPPKTMNVKLIIVSIIAMAGLLFQPSARVFAQTYPPHPTDPSATVIGTFWISLQIGSGKGAHLLAEEEKGCAVGMEIIVYRTSGGRVDYVMNTSSIRFTGTCAGVIDNIPTGQLFGMLSQLAVAQGITNGYTTCGPSCSVPTITKVYQSLCVSRTGVGNGTSFHSCDITASCEKEYSVCCPSGASGPSITLIGITPSGACGIGPNGVLCQTTCQ